MGNGSPNLDLAMRIGLELDDAVQQAAKLDATLDKVQGAGKNAATGLDAAATAANRETQAVKASTTAAEAKVAANTKLKASETAAAAAMTRTGNSAKQQAQAMRQLPMQMTDIAVGLASGQSPFMVAIQQGGQLKDSFGGIAPAARAVMGAVSPMFLAVGAGIGVIAGLAIALKQGEDRLSSFEQALILTGNSANLTADGLDAMASRLDETTEATSSRAAEAIKLVTDTGQFTAEQIEAVATAAVQMQDATGKALGDTIAEFVKLKKDPVNAILELNDAQHFLTEETLKQIQTLKDQGKESDAAAVAISAYAETINVRAPQVTESLGLIEGALHGIGNAGKEAWDEVVEGMKNADREARDGMNNLFGFFSRMRAGGPGGMWAATMGMGALPTPAAASTNPTVDTQTEKERQKAQDAWARQVQSNLSKQERLEAEIVDLRKTGLAAGKSEVQIEAQIAQARARYKESLPKTPKAPKSPKTEAQKDEEAAQRELENLTKQATLLGLVEDGEKRVSEEARVRYEIENGAYQAATAATKQKLLVAAKAKDIAQAEREAEEKRRQELEKTTKAYEQLQDTIRTPIEAAVDTVIDQIKALNAALDAGLVKAENYNAELAKIGNRALTPLPNFRDEVNQFGIGDPEADRMADMLSRLQSEYDERRAIINAALQQENADKAYWHAQSVQLEEQHQGALTNLAMAENQLRLLQAAGAFASMASIAKSFAGEQSKTYQVLFAISKGFAVAQAAVALAQNVAEASKVGFPQNIGLIAAAFAQGAQIAQLLSSAQYSPQGYAGGGSIRGPGTGTSDSIPIMASNDEFMVRARSARQAGARAFLDDFNARGMAALDDWRGFATGGAISADPVYSRNEGSYRPQTPSASANVLNRMRVYLAQDADHLMQMIASHPSTEKMVVGIAGQNGNAIRAEW